MKTNVTKEQLMLLQLVNYNKHGYTDIKVNHKDYLNGQPEKVEGFTPDLSAVINNQTVICGIKTNDSGNDDSIIQQWRAFSRNGNPFHVVVSKDSFQAVKEFAKWNGIKIAKYWCC